MPEEPEPTPEEWAEIEAADAYLDAVGNRHDFEGDPLGATEWRNDVDAEPINDSRFPSEIPGGATPSTTKGTPVSELDDQVNQVANQVANAGDMASIGGMLESFKAAVSQTLTTVAAAIGGTQECADVEAAGAQLIEQADGVYQALQNLNNVIAAAADATRRRARG